MGQNLTESKENNRAIKNKRKRRERQSEEKEQFNRKRTGKKETDHLK
jgi:hypothetical protein